MSARRLGHRVRHLPRRARAALGLAVVLLVVVGAVGATAIGGGGGGTAGTPGDRGTGSVDGRMPSTTLATGDLDIASPEGWQPVPLPSLGVGLAVPPGWEAVVLSPEGLAALARATPAVPGFVQDANAAAADRALVYAAGQDAEGRVSDALVRAALRTGVTDVAGLRRYARTLAASAGRTDPTVEGVEGADRPTVRMDFEVGAGRDERARGSEVLVLGPRDIVWSLVVTSEDTDLHDDLVASIARTLTFADRGR